MSTTGTLKTQGTHLYFADTATDSDPVLVKLDCPSGISGLGGAADQIQVECLDQTSDKEYIRGLGNPGAVSVPFNLKPTEISHQLLFTLKDAGTTLNWLVCLSDGTDAPTMDTDGVIAKPTTRSSIAFSGYISDVTIDIATNTIVKGTLSIQRSGAVTLTAKSA